MATMESLIFSNWTIVVGMSIKMKLMDSVPSAQVRRD